MKTLPWESTATVIGLVSHALVAEPPSPHAPVEGVQGCPVPANVEMFPLATSRITRLRLSAIKMFPEELRTTP